MLENNSFDVYKIVNSGTDFLLRHGFDSRQANISSTILAEYCLHAPLYMVQNFTVDQLDKFTELIVKRSEFVPLQHLTGIAHFRYLQLACNKNVFIPRPETEMIIDEVIDYCNNAKKDKYNILDLCSGSGNIAISIATELPITSVVGVDISEDAIALSKINNKNYGSKVKKFILGDVTNLKWCNALDNFSESQMPVFDCIVTNPPYIPSDRIFNKENSSVYYDPSSALYGGGKDGLCIPKKIVDCSIKILKKGGLFIIEHDDTNQQELLEYMSFKNFSSLMPILDLNNKPRFIKAIY